MRITLNPNTRTFMLLEMVLNLSLASVLYGGVAKARGGGVAQSIAGGTPCYAYVLQGDIWVKCKAQRLQITRFGNVYNFAAVPGGQGLALLRDGALGADVFSFPQGGVRHQKTFPSTKAAEVSLVATCGTALVQGNSPPPTWHDAFTGQPIIKPPYREFKCSSDGSAVVGFQASQIYVLETGFPPRKLYVGHGPGGWISPIAYDISPNGKFVAYQTAEKTCVQSLPRGVPRCAAFAASLIGFSVSDDGSVLYGNCYANLTADGTCYYNDKNRWKSSLRPRPGYNHTGGCYAVGLWRPGLKEPKILVPLGLSPQWITPKAASALIKWSKQQRTSAPRVQP